MDTDPTDPYIIETNKLEDNTYYCHAEAILL